MTIAFATQRDARSARQLRASADVEAALAKMEAVAAEAGDEHEVELALTRMIETVSIEHARCAVGVQMSS